MKTCLHKDLYASVHSINILNKQKLEVIQMPIKWCTSEQNVGQLYMGCSLGAEGQTTDTHGTIWVKLKHVFQNERSQT